jgi:hypothetical protein
MDAGRAGMQGQLGNRDAHRLPSTLLSDARALSLQLTVAIAAADRDHDPIVCPLLLAKQHVAHAVRILTEAECQI